MAIRPVQASPGTGDIDIIVSNHRLQHDRSPIKTAHAVVADAFGGLWRIHERSHDDFIAGTGNQHLLGFIWWHCRRCRCINLALGIRLEVAMAEHRHLRDLLQCNVVDRRFGLGSVILIEEGCNDV
jgi:hypothetical protein